MMSKLFSYVKVDVKGSRDATNLYSLTPLPVTITTPCLLSLFPL